MKNKRKKVLTGKSDRLKITNMQSRMNKKRLAIIARLNPTQKLNLAALVRSGALK